MTSKRGAKAAPDDPFLRELLDAFGSGMWRATKRRRYSSDEKKAAVESIQRGLSYTQVARKLGSTPAAVRYWCKLAGVSTARRRTWKR